MLDVHASVRKWMSRGEAVDGARKLGHWRER